LTESHPGCRWWSRWWSWRKGFRNWERLLCEVHAEAEETVKRREFNTT